MMTMLCADVQDVYKVKKENCRSTKVWSKIVALVEGFPKVCGTSPVHM